jgi:predicted Zn-dependent protease
MLGFMLFGVACARDPGDRVRAQVQVVRQASKPELLLARGRAFAEIGDLTRAEEYLSAALDNGGKPEVILPLLVAICVRDQRYRSAAQYLEDHLRSHPRKHQLRFLLGTLYIGLEKKEAARAELERVLAERPAHAQAHYALAVLHRDGRGDFISAERHFRGYLSHCSPHCVHADEAAESLSVEVP